MMFKRARRPLRAKRLQPPQSRSASERGGNALGGVSGALLLPCSWSFPDFFEHRAEPAMLGFKSKPLRLSVRWAATVPAMPSGPGVGNLGLVQISREDFSSPCPPHEQRSRNQPAPVAIR